MRLPFDKLGRRDQHSGGAKATLQRIPCVKSSLEFRQIPAIARAFNGLHTGIFRLHREDQASAHHLAIETNGAGTAHAMLAADTRALIWSESLRKSIR